jgi:hypothetical protein
MVILRALTRVPFFSDRAVRVIAFRRPDNGPVKHNRSLSSDFEQITLEHPGIARPRG